MSLPKPLHQLRSDVGSVLNAINEYERMVLRETWTGVPSAAQRQDKAYRDIESRMLAACERIGVVPHEKRQWLDLITAQRDELARRACTINLLQQETR